MNYNEHNETNAFLDYLASNSFLPLILQPIRITSHFNTVIDNIFSNVIDPDISGNKFNIYERDWSRFDQENFILEENFIILFG